MRLENYIIGIIVFQRNEKDSKAKVMAPKEEATSKAVYDYLLSTNRPYSVNDIVMNLHKEHGKAAVQRVVDSLVTEGKLKVKLNGKQSCYFINQDLLDTCSEQELEELDKKCAELDDKVRSQSEVVKQMETKLRTLTSAPTNDEAQAELDKVLESNKVLEERLAKLENNQEVISEEDKKKIVDLHTKAVGQWRKRKRMASDVLDSVLEGWPKSKQNLLDEIGVDTDESVGAKVPQR